LGSSSRDPFWGSAFGFASGTSPGRLRSIVSKREAMSLPLKTGRADPSGAGGGADTWGAGCSDPSGTSGGSGTFGLGAKTSGAAGTDAGDDTPLPFSGATRFVPGIGL